jgi:dTDP-4-dehydrorhamnose 3,5-epimerase
MNDQTLAVAEKRGLMSGTLPAGVHVFDLSRLTHDRGTLTEIYRQDWWPYGPARQWNLVTSPAGILRGIHVHTRSAEYYALVSGAAFVGYRDLRPGSPTLGCTALVELRGPGPQAIVAPPGIAHGVYSVEALTLLVGTTATRDPSAELGCHWRDAELEIPWPFETAVVSSQDAALGRLRDLHGSVPAYEPPRRPG